MGGTDLMDTQPLVNIVKNVHHRNTSIATFRASLTELEKKPYFFSLVGKAGEIAIAHYMYVQRWFSGRQYQNWSM